jgi:hypothetical protein
VRARGRGQQFVISDRKRTVAQLRELGRVCGHLVDARLELLRRVEGQRPSFRHI